MVSNQDSLRLGGKDQVSRAWWWIGYGWGLGFEGLREYFGSRFALLRVSKQVVLDDDMP